ncbi:hypothetical protein CPC08DRAFT_815150 [Agrocybe pediades]|nr:hypothetical protein CPC08DRAFT_815150 [Agrocybe pediades]
MSAPSRRGAPSRAALAASMANIPPSGGVSMPAVACQPTPAAVPVPNVTVPDYWPHSELHPQPPRTLHRQDTEPIIDIYTLDKSVIYQEYLKAQREIDRLTRELASTKDKLAALSLTKKSGDSRSRELGKKSTVLAEAIEKAMLEEAGDSSNVAAVALLTGDYTHSIRKLAQTCVAFRALYVDLDHFTNQRPSFSSESVERYECADKDVNDSPSGVTAELYEHIPPKYHSVMSNKDSSVSATFRNTFREIISQTRSDTIRTLKGSIAILFPLNPETLATPLNSRDSAPQLVQLLQIQQDPAEPGKKKYARLPPLLYQNGNPSKLREVFLSPFLFRVARCILFGTAAIPQLDKKARARPNSVFIPPKPYVPRTTFSFIAFCAIAARHILTKDTRFDHTGMGDETGIAYGKDYNYYKRMLVEAWNDIEARPWTQKLLRTWDFNVLQEHLKFIGAALDREDNGSEATASTLNEIGTEDSIARQLQGLRMSTPSPSSEIDSDNNAIPHNSTHQSRHHSTIPSNAIEDHDHASDSDVDICHYTSPEALAIQATITAQSNHAAASTSRLHAPTTVARRLQGEPTMIPQPRPISEARQLAPPRILTGEPTIIASTIPNAPDLQVPTTAAANNSNVSNVPCAPTVTTRQHDARARRLAEAAASTNSGPIQDDSGVPGLEDAVPATTGRRTGLRSRTKRS